MSLFANESLKHRVVGIVVILSILLVCVPALLKQSHDMLDNSPMIVSLPEKPVKPQVDVARKEDVFKPMQIAQVDLTSEPELTIQSSAPITKAQPLYEKPPENKVTQKPTRHSKKYVDNKAVRIKPAKSKPAAAIITKTHYRVQIASFKDKKNAVHLVKRLKGKGYLANYQLANTKNTAYYKVLVGQLASRRDAEKLQTKLNHTTQLAGIIIRTKG